MCIRDSPEAERRYRQSLDIFERLGDQAGAAKGYHNLGVLAQDRGDYPEAERRYRQSLDIDERLGNQAGVATSYHALGGLAAQTGAPSAVPLTLDALAIRQRIGDPRATSSLRQLRRLRAMIGKDQFDGILHQQLDDES